MTTSARAAESRTVRSCGALNEQTPCVSAMESRRRDVSGNLSLLQNLMKRDPESYRSEFMDHLENFRSGISLFMLQPTQPNQELQEKITFLSHVTSLYKNVRLDFHETLISCLRQHGAVMPSDIRLTMCQALMLLKNKDMVQPFDVLRLFFRLFRCNDKLLRHTLYVYIVSDIKNMNVRRRSQKLNVALQNFMFEMVSDNTEIASYLSLRVIIDLYRKSVWRDAKTVNVVVTACMSPFKKVYTTALAFFVGSEDAPDDESNSEDEPESVAAKKLKMASRVNKKTQKNRRKLEKALEMLKKSKKKNAQTGCNFTAIQLIHDPQGFAEKLFKRAESFKGNYNLWLLMLNLISRLVGVHELILLNFYPYLQKYLKPHQRDVTKILTYLAQSAHQMVPPDAIEPCLRSLLNNFVTDVNSNEVITVGLNTVREMCNRAPLIMTAELLQDLTAYKKSADKNVVMASRSLIQLFRLLNPELLARKDRGIPLEGMESFHVQSYGASVPSTFVSGVDLLNPDELAGDGDGVEDLVDSDSDSDSFGDMELGEEEESEDTYGPSEDNPLNGKVGAENREEIATNICCNTFLSNADFRKIQEKKAQQLVTRKVKKRQRAAPTMEPARPDDIVDISRIEHVSKKARLDREARVALAKSGREDSEKPDRSKWRMNAHASTTNKEKQKSKPFMMVKHTRRVNEKRKRSFHDRMVSLRDSLLKQQRMKR